MYNLIDYIYLFTYLHDTVRFTYVHEILVVFWCKICFECSFKIRKELSKNERPFKFCQVHWCLHSIIFVMRFKTFNNIQTFCVIRTLCNWWLLSPLQKHFNIQQLQSWFSFIKYWEMITLHKLYTICLRCVLTFNVKCLKLLRLTN